MTFGNRTDVPKEAIWRYVDGSGWVAFPGWFAEVFDQVGVPADQFVLPQETLSQIPPELLSQAAWGRQEYEAMLAPFQSKYGNRGFWAGTLPFLGSLAGIAIGLPGVPGSGLVGGTLAGGGGAASTIQNVLQAGGGAGGAAGLVGNYIRLMAQLGITGPLFDNEGRPLYDGQGNRLPQAEPEGTQPEGLETPDTGTPTYTAEGTASAQEGGGSIRGSLGSVLGPVRIPPPPGGSNLGGVYVPDRGIPTFEAEGTARPDPDLPQRPIPIFPPQFPPVGPGQVRGENQSVDVTDKMPPVEPHPSPIGNVLTPGPVPPITVPPGTGATVGGGGGGLPNVPGLPGGVPGMGGGGQGAPMPGGFVGPVGGGPPLESLMRFEYKPPFVPGLGYFLNGGGR